MFSLIQQNLKRTRVNLGLAFSHWRDSDLHFETVKLEKVYFCGSFSSEPGSPNTNL